MKVMNARSRTRATVALAMSWAVGACAGGEAGGQTGDEDALPRRIRIPTAAADRGCAMEDPAVVLTSLDDDRAGFSPREVLDYAEGRFTAALTWHPDSFHEWETDRREITPAPSGVETLELEVTHSGGTIRYIGPSDSPPCGRIDIDMQVTMKTASDALNEQVDAVLRAWGTDASDARLAIAFQGPGFEIDVPPVTDGPPPPPVFPLAGALSVTKTLRYAPEDADPDDPAAQTLTDTGEMALIETEFIFRPARLEGRIDAWLYGHESGILQLADGIATIAEP
jgi:hypothetical protein